MIAIVVRLLGSNGESTRYEVDKHEATFGRVPGNDVVLPRGNVSKRQFKLVVMGSSRLIVHDMKSTGGTWVNGRKLRAPQQLQPEDEIWLSECTVHAAIVTTLSATPEAIADPTEARLLHDLARGEDQVRAVYADWLEQHGRLEYAEFLRLRDQAGDARRVGHALWKRLDELAGSLDPDWRLRVARPVIATCDDTRCPRVWEKLRPTERAHVRTCGRCTRAVYYCARPKDLPTERALGGVVAVDVPLEAEPEGL